MLLLIISGNEVVDAFMGASCKQRVRHVWEPPATRRPGHITTGAYAGDHARLLRRNGMEFVQPAGMAYSTR